MTVTFSLVTHVRPGPEIWLELPISYKREKKSGEKDAFKTNRPWGQLLQNILILVSVSNIITIL